MYVPFWLGEQCKLEGEEMVKVKVFIYCGFVILGYGEFRRLFILLMLESSLVHVKLKVGQ